MESTPKKQPQSEKSESTAAPKTRKPPKPYNKAGGGGISVQRLNEIPGVWPIHPSIIRDDQ